MTAVRQTAVQPDIRPGTPGTARSVVTRTRLRRGARATAVTLTLAGVCFAVLCVSLSLGKVDIPVLDVARALFGAGDDGTGYIVTRVRLPRAMVGILAGVAFALSGAIFQTLVRNPLASPDMIGITVGASAAAVVGITMLGLSGYAVSAAAFAGAFATVAVIYVLAWRRGVSGYRLVLVGVALGAMLTSVVSYSLTRADVYDAREALGWLTGSLNAKSWETARTLGLILAVLVPAALLSGRRLAVLHLGDDVARALGMAVERSRAYLILVATALAAAATAAAGPVASVALVSGPIARRLVGDGGSALVPAAFVGALVMTAGDFIGQHAIPSTELPVGVVTAVVGAPYLLWLLAVGGRFVRTR